MRVPFDPDSVATWLAKYFDVPNSRNGVRTRINDDDCAILCFGRLTFVLTTDFLNATPIANQLGIGSPFSTGRLTVASSLSDLAGTGAIPCALMMGVMFPKGETLDEFKAVMRGVKTEARRWHVPLVGGDTKIGTSPSFYSVGLGVLPSGGRLFPRNGAGPNQSVWVSGPLGNCAAAVIAMTRLSASRSMRSWARRVLTVPNLPLDNSARLSSARYGRGGTDLSDGLGRGLWGLATSSCVGIELDVARLPLSHNTIQVAAAAKVPPWTLAFATGGDFQFLVTTPKHVRQADCLAGFHWVGTTNGTGQVSLVLPTGRKTLLPQIWHRDLRSTSFAGEIEENIQELSNA